jgi:GTPase SAR1 family protein
MRVLLVGDSEVGKTSLIRRLADRPLHQTYTPTGYFAIETVTSELEVIEVPGSERDRVFSPRAFADVDRIVIMLAMDDIRSVYTLHDWVEQYRRYQKPISVLVNKVDTLPTSERINGYGWRFISTTMDSKEILFNALLA